MKKLMAILPCAVVALLLCSCMRDNLMFGTTTRFDVAGAELDTTGKVGLDIGYERAELVYVPSTRKRCQSKVDSGTLGSDKGYSVLGSFKGLMADGLESYCIDEKFATGVAAEVVARSVKKETGGEMLEPVLDTSAPTIVATGTRFSFHVNFSKDTTPVEVALGYKRQNLAIVPTGKDANGSPKARSVFAKFFFARSGLVPDRYKVGDKTPRLVIDQLIATGNAAVTAAGSPAAKEMFQNEFTIVANQATIDSLKERCRALAGKKKLAAWIKIGELSEDDEPPDTDDKADKLIANMAAAKRTSLKEFLDKQ